MGIPTLNSFALLPTTPREVVEIAPKAKYMPTRAEGPCGIDSLEGRITIYFMADIIAEIINSAFETGSINPELIRVE